MADIEVEAVESIDESAVPVGVDAPDVVLYGGKGGVGKTTMAAATALASARDGTPTLVISTDPAHSLSDVFERPVPAEPAEIHDVYPLFGVEIDPEAALAEGGPFGAGGDPLGGLSDLLGGSDDLLGGADDLLGGPDGPLAGPGDEREGDVDLGDLLGGGAMPGADEVAAVRLLLAHLDDDRFERVVVDTAPTGHTLRLLELPELLETAVGRLLRIRVRVRGMLDGVKGLFGGADEPDLDTGADSLRELGERIERLRALLSDPDSTDFRVVLVPEEMSIAESERLRERLADHDIPVGTVVVNRVMEDLADVAGAVDADWYVAPNHEDCEFCARRWAVQRRALESAQDLFRGTDVRRVPLFADEVRGEAMLRAVAACLE